MYNSTEIRVAKQLQEAVELELSRLGLMCRVFSRAKSEDSLNKKISHNPGKYSPSGKLIQDAFGVRVALYFCDDQPIAIDSLKNRFEYDERSSTIDSHPGNTFAAIRCNLVFRLPAELAEECHIFKRMDCIDRTFEVQIRTILSEGWHEVEHDMRYKCQDDWQPHTDLDRALNGIYASLETSDWSMLKLFEDLAYRHYRSGEWTQMLRVKFRLRSTGALSIELLAALNANMNIGKAIYRIDRTKFLETISNKEISIPITPDNIVYICNHFFINDVSIANLTPPPITDIFSEATQHRISTRQ